MADYKNIVLHIRKSEGGLSANPKDSASKNSSPCGKDKNGNPSTNKGLGIAGIVMGSITSLFGLIFTLAILANL